MGCTNGIKIEFNFGEEEVLSYFLKKKKKKKFFFSSPRGGGGGDFFGLFVGSLIMLSKSIHGGFPPPL